MKAVCFDLNKTLIKENSWRDLNLAMNVKSEEDDMLMSWGERGIITDSQGQNILLNIYKESGRHSKDNILKVLSNYTYNDYAKEIIKYLESNGFVIFLISGSINILVEKIANELGIKYWKANNEFVFDKKGYLEKINTLDNDKKAKVFQLKELCKETDISIKDVYCVGDGDNDIEIFKVTGKGITFSGSKIEKDAWKVINKLEDIKDLI
ncbi:MAG TPA: HAD-IB family phosphatase [Candidatus Dojkabacteria bacterium]|nr:HAD-IB family phosphatase [Candidatus Dojkabacteria bacterium]